LTSVFVTVVEALRMNPDKYEVINNSNTSTIMAVSFMVVLHLRQYLQLRLQNPVKITIAMNTMKYSIGSKDSLTIC
jgi:hypothetical protein